VAQGVCPVCEGEFGRIGSDLERLGQALVSAVDSGNTAEACQFQQQLTKLQADHNVQLKKRARRWAIAVSQNHNLQLLSEVRLDICILERWLSSGTYQGLDASVVEGILIERKAELAALRGQLTICKWCNEQ
jgi:hypothetical protein